MFQPGWKTRRNAALARAERHKHGSSAYRRWRERQLQREALGRRLADLVIDHAALVDERARLAKFIVTMGNKAADADRLLDEAAPAVLQARHRIGDLAGLIVAAERAVEAERAAYAIGVEAFDRETARLKALEAGNVADSASAEEAARAAFETAQAEARARRERDAIILPADVDEAKPAPKPRNRTKH